VLGREHDPSIAENADECLITLVAAAVGEPVGDLVVEVPIAPQPVAVGRDHQHVQGAHDEGGDADERQPSAKASRESEHSRVWNQPLVGRGHLPYGGCPEDLSRRVDTSAAEAALGEPR
jgi:hypothetical protein